MKILKVAGSSFDNLKRLVVKIWNGKSDTRTAIEASPYGIDSNPVKDMVAIYAKTELDGNEYIIGYLNKNRLAEIGETRLFSTDSTGNLKAFVWLKSDGIANLNGDINGGLIKIDNLKSQYDANLLNIKNSVLAALSPVDAIMVTLGMPAPLATQIFTTAYASVLNLNKTPLENTKVKHGNG